MIGLEHYLTVAATLFVIGAFGYMMRDPAKAMELKDVKPGQGL
ncbi:MAG: hypothetical protein AAF408_02030 [Pseudomonadota bacterium]